MLNPLEPIFEPVFDEANFGYLEGDRHKDAPRKLWRGIHSGGEWIVDADLKDVLGLLIIRNSSRWWRNRWPMDEYYA